ncbi:MAG TPA: hypothetical protein VLK35_21845 [Methylomirabilota bacterium]|jgi:hypothetical protein|nr:hypothetical protein [Methylomirabilota bacterium]
MPLGDFPILVYAALLAALLLVLVRYRGLMHGVRRRVTRTVWCPVHDRKVTASLEEEVWDGRRVDVDQCSAFSPPTAVTCRKACLRLTERPRPAIASSIPPLF